MICDIAYVLLLEQVDRQTAADLHAAAVFMSVGAEVTAPSFIEARNQFNELLMEPVETDPLREVLGIT